MEESKTKKLYIYILFMVLMLILCGCATKLTTVRPSEISLLTVERLSDGITVSLPYSPESGDLKDTLIFQLEEPYKEVSACSENDGHCYKVSLYLGAENKKLDTEVVINSDGSVCKNGKRYVADVTAEQPVMIANWEALFPKDEIADEQLTDEGEMKIVSAQGSAEVMQDGFEIMSSIAVAEILPWSYYISDICCDNQNYVMVWRDTPSGSDAQWLCSVEQMNSNSSLRHSIEYVKGSYERSGEKYLYFSITDANSFHSSLWCLNLETEYFNCVLDAPCSNMILLKVEPSDAQGIGWVVYEHYLTAVDLAEGSTYEGLSVDLDEYIEDSLFYEIGDFGTHKFVRLSDLGKNNLQIDVVTAEPETSAPEQRSSYQIDILSREFTNSKV